MDMHDGHYRPVTPEIIAALEAICGHEGVVAGDPKRLDKFARDAVGDRKYGRRPEVVVMPADTEGVAAVLRLANEAHVPVTPRAGGSGLSGGAVAACGGIVLSVERMNRILEIDTRNLMAVVEPGVITNHLDAALEPHGLFFAGYPMSEEICCIGGNVAENAGGGRAVKYGVTGRYIHGLEMVTPEGRVFQAGGKRVKDVTGYDLVQLMIGSEGTLGIFTKIFIRLLPRPVHRVTLLALFDRADAAVALVARVMAEGGLIPSAVEFMDGEVFALAARELKYDFPYARTRAALLFEVDGRFADTVAREADTVAELCRAGQAVEIRRAADETEAEGFWNIRKRIIWVLKRHAPRQSVEDIVVPIAAITELLPELEVIGRRYGVRIPVYGHAADGNIHATPLKNPDQSEEDWSALLPDLLSDIYRSTARLGGTISGEHGIGHKRRDFMELVMNPAQIDVMRRIKDALDPNHILNPGKILPP